MMILLGSANNKAIFRGIARLELLSNFDLEDMESNHSESFESDTEEKYSCFKKKSIAGGKQKYSKKQKRYDSESKRCYFFTLLSTLHYFLMFFRSLQIVVCRMWKQFPFVTFSCLYFSADI